MSLLKRLVAGIPRVSYVPATGRVGLTSLQRKSHVEIAFCILSYGWTRSSGLLHCGDGYSAAPVERKLGLAVKIFEQLSHKEDLRACNVLQWNRRLALSSAPALGQRKTASMYSTSGLPYLTRSDIADATSRILNRNSRYQYRI